MIRPSAQREGNRLIERQSAASRPIRVKVCRVRLRAERRHFLIIFNPLDAGHGGVDRLAQRLCRAQQSSSPPRLVMRPRDEGQAFQLVCNGRPVAAIFPLQNGTAIGFFGLFNIA